MTWNECVFSNALTTEPVVCEHMNEWTYNEWLLIYFNSWFILMEVVAKVSGKWCTLCTWAACYWANNNQILGWDFNTINIICITEEKAFKLSDSFQWNANKFVQMEKKIVQSRCVTTPAHNGIFWNHHQINVDNCASVNFRARSGIYGRINFKVENTMQNATQFSDGIAQFGTWHCKTCVVRWILSDGWLHCYNLNTNCDIRFIRFHSVPFRSTLPSDWLPACLPLSLSIECLHTFLWLLLCSNKHEEFYSSFGVINANGMNKFK